MASPDKIVLEQNTENNNYDIKLYLDGKPILWKNINNLSIKESIYSLIPRIELSFNDSNLFVEHNPVVEGQEIEITLSLNKESQNIINQKFMVLSSTVLPMNNTNTSYTITILGILNKPSLINGIINKSYPKATFSEVVDELAIRNNLRFDGRIQSKDKMNWYQLNQTDNDFLNDSIYRSYVSDDDVPFCFINRSNELVYTSLKTESKKKTSIILRKDINKALTKNEDTGFERYFSSFTYIDKSGFNNTFGNAYGVKKSFYDGEKLISKDIKDSPHSGLTKIRNKRDDLFGTINDVMNFGTLNNVYDNYFDSLIKNNMSRTSLFSNSIIVNAKPDNYKLFDKINIEITKGNNNNLLQTQSGNYIIGSIIHNVSNNGRYNQVLLCFRDGVGNNNSTSLFKNPLKET